MGWFASASGRKAVIFLGGALLAGGSLFAVACGTDNGNVDDSPLPTPDGSKADGKAGDGGTVDPGDSSTPPGDGGGADCGLAPKVRSNANSFYCSFVRDGGPDSGNPSYCDNNETCCNGGCAQRDANGKCTKFGESYCIAANNKGTALQGAAPYNFGASGQTACSASSDWVSDGGSTWECADKNQCGQGQVCCLFTGVGYNQTTDKVNIGNNLDTDIPKACGALQAFKQGGTRCAASCTANTEIRLCSNSDQNCGANQKCTPFEALNRDLAYCK